MGINFSVASDAGDAGSDRAQQADDDIPRIVVQSRMKIQRVMAPETVTMMLS